MTFRKVKAAALFVDAGNVEGVEQGDLCAVPELPLNRSCIDLQA